MISIRSRVLSILGTRKGDTTPGYEYHCLGSYYIIVGPIMDLEYYPAYDVVVMCSKCGNKYYADSKVFTGGTIKVLILKI